MFTICIKLWKGNHCFYQNVINQSGLICSKVIAILLNWWFLPISGLAVVGSVCTLQSSLVKSSNTEKPQWQCFCICGTNRRHWSIGLNLFFNGHNQWLGFTITVETETFENIVLLNRYQDFFGTFVKPFKGHKLWDSWRQYLSKLTFFNFA